MTWPSPRRLCVCRGSGRVCEEEGKAHVDVCQGVEQGVVGWQGGGERVSDVRQRRERGCLAGEEEGEVGGCG